MLKKNKVKSFQKKGADVRKAAVAERVTRRLSDLRREIATGKIAGPFSKNFVLRWLEVDKHTIKEAYHAKSAKEIEDFLLETDLACGIVERKPKNPPKKRSMRQQMAALAQEAEAMRLRMQIQIDDLMDQLQSKSKGCRRSDLKNFRSIVRPAGGAADAPSVAGAA